MSISMGTRQDGAIMVFQHYGSPEASSTVAISMDASEAVWLRDALSKQLPTTLEADIAATFLDLFSSVTPERLEGVLQSGVLTPEHVLKMVRLFELASRLTSKKEEGVSP